MVFSRILAGVLVTCLFPAWAGAAVPGFVPYAARLSDGTGEGQTLQLDLSLALHDAAEGGAVLWEHTYPGVIVVDGFFTLTLDQGTVPGVGTLGVGEVFAVHGAVWLGVSVEGQAEIAPRTPVGSTPYALHAAHAAHAAHAV